MGTFLWNSFQMLLVVPSDIPQFQSQSCHRAGQYLGAPDLSWSRSPSWGFAALSPNDPLWAWTSEPPPGDNGWAGRWNWSWTNDTIPTLVTYLASILLPSLVNSTERALPRQLQDVIRVHVDGEQQQEQEANVHSHLTEGNFSVPLVDTNCHFLCSITRTCSLGVTTVNLTSRNVWLVALYRC